MPQNPLQNLFASHVQSAFRTADILDRDIAAYVSNMMLRFVRSDEVNCATVGADTLQDLGEMAEKADPVFGTACSFGEERRVRQHVGDAALFFAGLYPGAAHYRQRNQHRVQTTRDLVRIGRESYYIVSQFDVFEHRQEARLFSKLADRFDDCVSGLAIVRERILTS